MQKYIHTKSLLTHILNESDKHNSILYDFQCFVSVIHFDQRCNYILFLCLPTEKPGCNHSKKKSHVFCGIVDLILRTA